MPLEVHPYKLLLYTEGCHFVKHRDTEKEPRMFATLVSSFPLFTRAASSLFTTLTAPSLCTTLAAPTALHSMRRNLPSITPTVSTSSSPSRPDTGSHSCTRFAGLRATVTLTCFKVTKSNGCSRHN
ncbi:hypothetical protein BCR44DRAFT_1187505 [Catenaria anguillulae PL171]|uniref:Uncharacterized protein n=1 Tax=Catenaria anguillulae PL171 TaxID=765915 RepID=A0A1Y2H3L1_9FUNG|nr:hypothetical protein BCR44DRAFT_1187505 [Catenaria anguillulae PL171]